MASDSRESSARRLVRRAGVVRSTIATDLRQWLLRARNVAGRPIEHVHGPARIELAANEVVLLCLVRDGAPWLHTFLRHHADLGVRHKVLLDTGSEDDTIGIAQRHENTSVFRTTVPYRKYKTVLKRWLAESFAGAGWCLYCDIDELFDYPFSSRLPLRGLLEYLATRGYDTMAAQMLDMFSEAPIETGTVNGDEDPAQRCRLYDVSDISRSSGAHWQRLNELPDVPLYSHSGGIRGRVFGVDGSVLTKHPLFRPAAGLKVFAFNDHFMTGGRIADVSGVLRHYKFTGTFPLQVEAAVRERQYHDNSRNYRRYREVLSEGGAVVLAGPRAREYGSAEELLDSGFLIASQSYRDWVDEHGSN